MTLKRLCVDLDPQITREMANLFNLQASIDLWRVPFGFSQRAYDHKGEF
jgi:hypothetical protein